MEWRFQFFFFFSEWQPCLFSGKLKPFFKRNEEISSYFTRQNAPVLAAVKREKFAKVKVVIFTVLSLIYYQYTLNLTKRFESLLKKFLAVENYELQNCWRHLPT